MVTVLTSLKPLGGFALAFSLVFMALYRPFRRRASNELMFVCLTIPAVFAFLHMNDLSLDEAINELFGRLVLNGLAHASFLLLLLPKESTNCRSAREAIKLIFSLRGVGTPWKVRRLPLSAGPSAQKLRPDWAVKRSFILRRGLILLGRYLLLRLYTDPRVHGFVFGDRYFTQIDFLRTTFWRHLIFPDPSVPWSVIGRNGRLRLRVVLDDLIENYLCLSSMHEGLAIVSVGIGLDSPEEWPPLFGNIADAYTLRGYWSSFWHQLVNRSFSAHAWFLLTTIFRIPKGSVAGRYLSNMLVFVLSGLAHWLMFASMSFNPECSQRGIAIWYTIQFLGIVAEEIVQLLVKRAEKIYGLDNGNQSPAYGWAKRAVGYLWVFWWFFTLKPKTAFPDIFCEIRWPF